MLRVDFHLLDALHFDKQWLPAHVRHKHQAAMLASVQTGPTSFNPAATPAELHTLQTASIHPREKNAPMNGYKLRAMHSIKIEGHLTFSFQFWQMTHSQEIFCRRQVF